MKVATFWTDKGKYAKINDQFISVFGKIDDSKVKTAKNGRQYAVVEVKLVRSKSNKYYFEIINGDN